MKQPSRDSRGSRPLGRRSRLQDQIPARDVAGSFGGEEADEVGDFDKSAETADGQSLRDGLELLKGGVFARDAGH